MLPLEARSQQATIVWLCIVLFLSASIPGWTQQADFSFVQSSNCSPQTVTFKSLATGNPTSWKWDMGNGNVFNNNTPADVSVVYIAAGTYTVTLTVSNGTTSHSASKNVVVHASPKAAFDIDLPLSECAPRDVQFLNESTDKPERELSYRWVFGDGGSSEEENPIHTYTGPGSYSVTLTVTNDMGCDTTIVKTEVITVQGLDPEFSTNAQGSLCSAPASIEFSSTGDEAASYEWDFGDGSTGQGKEIIHVYNTTGTFTASLTIADADGCSSTITENIFIGSEAGADFTVSSDKVCTGSEISFTPILDGVVETLQWDFGDGSTSPETNPEKQYLQADTYTVTLIVKLLGKECESIISKQVQVVADAIPDFEHKANCSGQATFTNESTNSTSWLWDFGDGQTSLAKSPQHAYSNSGTYLVTLHAFNSAGCRATIVKGVIIAPPPIVNFLPSAEQSCSEGSLAGCAPFELALVNMSSSLVAITEYRWEFGDGTTSTEENPTHVYDTGSFTLKLTIENQIGCESTMSRQVNVASTKPVADFEIDTTNVCVNQGVQFTSLSTGANAYCWDFGDGTGSQGEVVSHSYAEPGTYTVSLIAKNDGCYSDIVVGEAIVVNDPYVEFGQSKDCNSPFDVNFTNLSQQYDRFRWDFGDGTLDSTTNSPHHHYSVTGQYLVSLTASNSITGCEVSASEPVTIQQIKADFIADKANVCLGDVVFLADTSEFAVRWRWDFGNALISAVPDATTSYTTPGTYNISLRVYDTDSCMSQKIVPVEVLNIVANYAHSDNSYCDSLRVSFEDLSTATPPVAKWLWNFGDGTTSESKNPVHFYMKDPDLISEWFTVSLRLYDSENNYCEIIRENDVFFSTPVADFLLNNLDYCIGAPVTFLNASIGASSVSWDFGNETSSTVYHPTTSYAQTGEYTIELTVTDALGCPDKISKSVSVTKPEALFNADDTFRECPPLVTTFRDSTSTAVTWKWSFGDGNTSTFENPINTYVRPGEYDVTLITADQNGCTDTLTVEKIVTIGGPDGIINVTPATVCVGDTIQYEAIANNVLIYRWDFGDGVVQDMAQPLTSHVYDEPGQSTIRAVFIDENGCEVAAPSEPTITNLGIPDVAFTYEDLHPFEDEPVMLTGTSELATGFEWYIDGSFYNTEGSTIITFEEPGLKMVTLRALNELGCHRDSTQMIFVQAVIDFIPNVFTPNQDTLNQTFEIPKVDMGFWNLQVYNRWGDLVHEEHNYKSHWDAKGLSAGVYYFVLRNAYRDKNFKGWVHVLY